MASATKMRRFGILSKQDGEVISIQNRTSGEPGEWRYARYDIFPDLPSEVRPGWWLRDGNFVSPESIESERLAVAEQARK